MHIFFSGIGGTGIGPLALIAKQAGYQVSGSDKQRSNYTDYLKTRGIDGVYIGQTTDQIQKIHDNNPIDWIVRSSAVTNDHPEIVFAKNNNIKVSKRDELLNKIISEKNLKLIAVAGTHGKTTTTAMVIWLFKQLGVPISYSVGAKISFGDMGEFDNKSEYFIYEADEYDRNFLTFTPYISLITGIDWDHPDIYPTKDEYNTAFRQFLSQSKFAYAWEEDAHKLGINESNNSLGIINKTDYPMFTLAGKVNREDAALATQGVLKALAKPDISTLADIVNKFPGVSRRFEKISKNTYSDYAHTPDKIRGALQLAEELNPDNIVVIYEGLHNTRQHFIKVDLTDLFSGVKKLYIVPSYRARENESLEDLTPEKLKALMYEPKNIETADLNQNLHNKIQAHANANDLVLCFSAGGGGSLDEWIRNEFAKS